jgi:hypothetical protein
MQRIYVHIDLKREREDTVRNFEQFSFLFLK